MIDIRWLHTGLGVVLIAAGVVGWYLLDHRSEWVAVALIGIGSFFVSKSLAAEMVKSALSFWRKE